MRNTSYLSGLSCLLVWKSENPFVLSGFCQRAINIAYGRDYDVVHCFDFNRFNTSAFSLSDRLNPFFTLSSSTLSGV